MAKRYEPLIKAIDAALRKADDDLEDLLDDEGRAEPKESVKAINRLDAKLTEALKKETKRIITAMKRRKTLSELIESDEFDRLFDDDTLTDEVKTIISGELKTLIPKLVRGYVKFVDKELIINRVSKRTLAWIDSWSGDLAKLMKLSDKTVIEKLIKDGFAEGGTVSTVTRAIKESSIRNEYYRARRVAVTEILRAHNVSKQEAALQNPSVTEKMWRHTGAHKNMPRENHVAMDGQRVPVDQPFTLIGRDGLIYHPMYPVDPELPPEEAINCHCLAQNVVDENILGLPLEIRQRLQREALESLDTDWEKEFNERNKARAGL